MLELNQLFKKKKVSISYKENLFFILKRILFNLNKLSWHIGKINVILISKRLDLKKNIKRLILLIQEFRLHEELEKKKIIKIK